MLPACIFTNHVVVSDITFRVIELLDQSLDYFGMGLRNVSSFSDIVFQIVKCQLFNVGTIFFRNMFLPAFTFFGAVKFRMHQMQFPITLAYRPQRLVLVKEERTIKLLLVAMKDL